MKREATIDAPPVRPVVMTTDLVGPDHAWHLIENVIQTEEGGLRSIYGPIPLLRTAAGGIPTNGALNPDTPVYGPCTAVFHARLRGGERDILLLHTDDEIWEFWGHARKWRRLVTSSTSTSQTALELPDPLPSDAPTQFCATPTGVIILPQRGRALFYDGDIVLPLGYDQAPTPPVGHGPGSSANRWAPDLTNDFYLGVNDTGYTMDGLENHRPSYMYPVWRGGRIGTVITPGDVIVSTATDKTHVAGYLLPGRFRCRTQLIDIWGNLSPLSGESNDVEWKRQPSMGLEAGGPPYTLRWVHADQALKQAAWDAVQPGPKGTIGRILCRTKDLVNSGDTKCYILPRDSMVTPDAFATIPDNVSECYPDNIPDAWLVAEPLDVMPFPPVRLAEMAFGRVFYANAVGDEGALFWSETGRWGTILKTSKSYPDPIGARITCLRRVGDGLVAFTENSLFRFVPNDAGDGFKPLAIPASVGTVSPNSVRMHRNGMLVFLGTDANFYGWDGERVQNLWPSLRLLPKRVQRARLPRAAACYDPVSNEYRCWLSILGEADFNNRCYIFDGSDWRQRDDVWADDVCVTQDHRRLVIAVGRVDTSDVNGIWVLDHAGDAQAATLKTAWIAASRSQERRSVFTCYLHLRETGDPADADRVEVEVRTNYRADVIATIPVATSYPALDTRFKPSSINPTFWDTSPAAYTSTYGSTGAAWRRRRPFWTKVDITVESVEAFQLTFNMPARTELLQIYWTERERDTQGAMNPSHART